jgi:hypothetical protein
LFPAQVQKLVFQNLDRYGLDSIQVDLQTRNGNVFSGRDCKQLAKCFYRLFELTDPICALGQSGKKVKALELTGEWADVRDPEILARLNSKL